MDNMTKLMIGAVLGFVGYMAYNKLKSVKTLIVTDNQTGPNSGIIGFTNSQNPYLTNQIAGMGRGSQYRWRR